MEFMPLLSSSRANLYWVNDGHTPILLECGSTQTQIMRLTGYKLGKAHGCLLTHSHLDHSRGAEGLMRYGLDLYCSEGTAESLGLNGHRLHLVEPLKQFGLGTWTILPFSTEHDCPGSLGFLLVSGKEKLLFATDTYFVRYRFIGLTMVAVECNWSKETLVPDIDLAVKKRLYRSHFSLENVLKFLGANDLSRVREIHLLHLSSDNSDAEMFRDRVQRATGKPVYVAQEKA